MEKKPNFAKASHGKSFSSRSRSTSSRGSSAGHPTRRNFSDSSSGFGSRGGYGRPRFGGASRRRKPVAKGIDISKFINKAVTTVEEVYTPVHTFNDFKLDNIVKKAVAERGYVIPSPIQDQAIPHLLDGQDLIGLANTGTGKTAAFLIPVIQKIIKDKKQKAIIITPTRELALQIQRESISLVKGTGIWNVCCVGGVPIRFHIADLKKRHNIIIGTPGRLKDLLDRGDLDISDVGTVILDEADRMLDMGFIDDVRYFLQHIQGEKQMMLFSATMPPEIERIVHDFLHNPVKVSVRSRDTSKNVDQDVVRVANGQQKIEVLSELLHSPDFTKTIIFVETKRAVDNLTDELKKRNFKAESIHGDKVHRERQRALKGFAAGDIDILIATDVAARGLDISGVSHVINYEIPQDYETYIHRIGRTGRADKKGFALTFV